MTSSTSFRQQAHQLVDWMADYLENVTDYPVKSPAAPGEIFQKIPAKPPVNAEAFDKIFADFNSVIVPGITHWQHPRFFGYFPANSSEPSVLAEMLMSTLGVQCMSWQTSPAATELEEAMMNWLRQMLGLPEHMTGVIQDTASSATICALLSARERQSDYQVNLDGLSEKPVYRVYASGEAHSSIEKAVKIVGIGANNLVKIPVDDCFAMDASALQQAIDEDKNNGYTPLCVVAAFGTTGSTAIDPLAEIVSVCKKEKIWCHVDAAYAGSALLLPEKRSLIKGIEDVDSFVFNPHKWMFTNFDCSAYFVKDAESLVKTFEILPEYLKTKEGTQVNNYRDWGIALGRRFRALKLWFVIRQMGVTGMQDKIRTHLRITDWLLKQINNHPQLEVLAPTPFNLICFRYKPQGLSDEALNALNLKLMNTINDDGYMYLTHTKLDGQTAIRWVIGQTNVNQALIEGAWQYFEETIANFRAE